MADVGGRLAGLVVPDVKALVVSPRTAGGGSAAPSPTRAPRSERGVAGPTCILGVLPGDDAGEAFLARPASRIHSTVWDLEVGSGDARAAARVAARTSGPADRRHPRPPGLRRPVQRGVRDASDAARDDARRRRGGLGQPRRPRARRTSSCSRRPTGRSLGFCATRAGPAARGRRRAAAEIWTIGVRPDAQGRGLGRQLLRWGVGHVRGLGVETVTLAVNGVNRGPSGLYESEGFVRTATRDRWARPVVPAER